MIGVRRCQAQLAQDVPDVLLDGALRDHENPGDRPGLGVFLLACSPWLGPFTWLAVLPLAGAALIFWAGYRLQRSVQA